MNWPFKRTSDPEDFSSLLPSGPGSFKDKLIAECQRKGVSVYVSDPSEARSGPYALLRAVASEVELQSRLNACLSLKRAMWANRIAWLALVIGVAALIAAIVK